MGIGLVFALVLSITPAGDLSSAREWKPEDATRAAGFHATHAEGPLTRPSLRGWSAALRYFACRWVPDGYHGELVLVWDGWHAPRLYDETSEASLW